MQLPLVIKSKSLSRMDPNSPDGAGGGQPFRVPFKDLEFGRNHLTDCDTLPPSGWLRISLKC